MKYINKKLPIMEIGTEIEWSDPGVSGMHFYAEGQVHCEKSTFNSLVEDGFIEEVKPREWWGIIDEDGILVHTSLQKGTLIRANQNESFIKVCEIIE